MLRYIVFQVVASTIAGEPVYGVVDILEPLPYGRNQSKLLRSARKTAGPHGYVLVNRVFDHDMPWSEWEASARRVVGTY